MGISGKRKEENINSDDGIKKPLWCKKQETIAKLEQEAAKAGLSKTALIERLIGDLQAVTKNRPFCPSSDGIRKPPGLRPGGRLAILRTLFGFVP